MITSLEVAKIINRRHSDIISSIENYSVQLEENGADATEWYTEGSYLVEGGNGVNYRKFNISSKGLKLLIDRFRKTPELEDLIVIYNDYTKNPVDVMVLNSRFEDSFFESLSEILEVMDYTLILQRVVDGCRIDGYIKELNLAIEYDESQHFTKKGIESDVSRELKIKSIIDCEFLRLNYKYPNAYNIGVVMNYIMVNFNK